MQPNLPFVNLQKLQDHPSLETDFLEALRDSFESQDSDSCIPCVRMDIVKDINGKEVGKYNLADHWSDQVNEDDREYLAIKNEPIEIGKEGNQEYSICQAYATDNRRPTYSSHFQHQSFLSYFETEGKPEKIKRFLSDEKTFLERIVLKDHDKANSYFQPVPFSGPDNQTKGMWYLVYDLGKVWETFHSLLEKIPKYLKKDFDKKTHTPVSVH